jgi:hypothetical protein
MSAQSGSVKISSVESLDMIVRHELTVIREKRNSLVSPEKPGILHYSVLTFCILVNIVFLFALPDYPKVFIAASFYLNMFYFIILVIPTKFTGTGLSKDEIARFHTWLKDGGFKSGTSRFTRLFINSFFINSRALSLGIGLMFSVDILFALLSYAFRDLPVIPALIVISQSFVIILFYLAVWKIEPFSMEFDRNVEQVRKRLYRENIPPWMVSLIFMTGILFAAFIFLTAIILLPGMTVMAFMSQSGLNELAFLILFIVILAVSQYFLIRHIHGTTSRQMAVRILDFQEDSLKELGRISEEGKNGMFPEHEDRSRRILPLLESRTYSIKKHTLLGKFPVYTIDIDISALMEIVVLTAMNHPVKEGE